MVSLVLVSLQSTVFSPARLGAFSPDLNLILLAYMALYTQSRAEGAIAVSSGFLMDALSGFPFGVYTLSRANIFVLVRVFSESLYSKNRVVEAAVLFLSTIYSWSFIWTAFIISGKHLGSPGIGSHVLQGVINTLVGLPLFWAIGKFHARL
jgi:rod shape-determining protein MreD